MTILILKAAVGGEVSVWWWTLFTALAGATVGALVARPAPDEKPLLIQLVELVPLRSRWPAVLLAFLVILVGAALGVEKESLDPSHRFWLCIVFVTAIGSLTLVAMLWGKSVIERRVDAVVQLEVDLPELEKVLAAACDRLGALIYEMIQEHKTIEDIAKLLDIDIVTAQKLNTRYVRLTLLARQA